MNKLAILVQSSKNIVTLQELGVLWQMPKKRKLTETVKYYIRTGKLRSLRKGLYAVTENYSPFELAQKIVPISYVSLQSALRFHGMIFQHYESVTSIALQSKQVVINETRFIFHKIKSSTLFNDQGVLKHNNYTLASPERTLCDSLYYYPSLSIDNTNMLNASKLIEIARIYENKSLLNRITHFIKTHHVRETKA